MHPPRPACRHRGRRPVRVVAARAMPPLHPVEVSAYLVGLEALALLQRFEPDFWAAHVAAQQVTPTLLIGAVAAFFQLQEQRGLALVWPNEGCYALQTAIEATPEATLVGFSDVEPSYLADECAPSVAQPRPTYYGIGLQLFLREGYSVTDPLTLALWWMAHGSALDVGIDIDALLDDARLAPGVEDAIRDLRMLPVMSVAACHQAATHLPESAGLAVPADLVRYAFSQTSNPLANISDDERDEVYGWEPGDHDWSERDQLAAWSGEAKTIQEAYLAWALRVKQAGPAGIVEVGRILHAAARRAKREEQARAEREGPELIKVLAHYGMLQEVL